MISVHFLFIFYEFFQHPQNMTALSIVERLRDNERNAVVVVFILYSSQKHSSLLMDRGIDARKQQDYDEGAFRCLTGRRNRGVDPAKDSNNERFSRAAAEMCDHARH